MSTNGTNLTQFYDELKQKMNNDEAPATNMMNVKMGPGGFNNSPNAMAWRNKAINCCNHLKDDCHKHLLLDIYCKILPLDKEFIQGNQGMMKQDIDSMLASKGMSATQYMTSCYESTKAPLLDFIIRSVNGIGRSYMEDADETLKNAQQTDEAIPEPEKPDTQDEEIQTQLVDITDDTEYENFVDTLKKKTIDKIVNDVSKIINDRKEEENMTFDTTPVADMEEQLESTTSIAMNYMQQKLMKENTEITSEMQNELIGMAIRESTMNQFDVVFKQPEGTFREFSSRIRFGKGVLINESAVNYFIESSEPSDKPTKLTASPLKRVGKVKFGMTRTEVKNAIGSTPKEFKKSKSSKNTTDDFGFCHVFYDANNECEAVEVFDNCQVSVKGIIVFPAKISSVKETIDGLKKDNNGYISTDKSIGIYMSDDKMKSIVFGKPGYFN